MGLKEIQKEANALLNNRAKISFYREKLKKLEGDDRMKAREELVSLIRKEGAVMLGGLNDPVEYVITYDIFGQGLEPIYFWLLDFLRGGKPSGLGMDVDKIDEQFDASASSAFLGEMGQRAGVMQDRAMKMLELVNTLIRSIINLIYDLKEFEIRLENYKVLKDKEASSDQKQAAELGLRAIWLDQVDMKKGRGSINNLAQQLQFVTLRDAFFYIKDESLKGPDGSPVDLNERVTRILKARFLEYKVWKEKSDDELTKRYKIEKHYLKTQVASLKLYTQWAKPYLRTAQKLGMKEFTTKSGLPSPDIVAAFNNMVMDLKLFAKSEIKPGSVHSNFQHTQLSKKYYACVELQFRYRTLPKIMGQGQYMQTGEAAITFRAFALTDEDIKNLEEYEGLKDLELVHQLTDVSLGQLQADLDHFTQDEEPKAEETKKKKGFEWPLGNVFEGFESHIGKPVKGAGKGFWEMIRPPGLGGEIPFVEASIYSKAKEDALTKCLVVYDIFKKAHRMTAW